MKLDLWFLLIMKKTYPFYPQSMNWRIFKAPESSALVMDFGSGNTFYSFRLPCGNPASGLQRMQQPVPKPGSEAEGLGPSTMDLYGRLPGISGLQLLPLYNGAAGLARLWNSVVFGLCIPKHHCTVEMWNEP